MNSKAILLGLLLSGFFAIACVRARGDRPGEKFTFSSLLHLTDRLERLRRSRWQWFSMVALILVLRLQQMQPLVLELILVVQFLIFLALPTQAKVSNKLVNISRS